MLGTRAGRQMNLNNSATSSHLRRRNATP